MRFCVKEKFNFVSVMFVNRILPLAGFIGMLVIALAFSANGEARSDLGFSGFKGLSIEKTLTKRGYAIAQAALKAAREITQIAAVPTRKPSNPYPNSTLYETDWPSGVRTSYAPANEEAPVHFSKDEGLSVRMSDDVSLTGGYHFNSADNTDFGGYDVDYKDHELTLGFTIKLP